MYGPKPFTKKAFTTLTQEEKEILCINMGSFYEEYKDDDELLKSINKRGSDLNFEHCWNEAFLSALNKLLGKVGKK